MNVLKFFHLCMKLMECFDRMPIYYQDTAMYIDPITRQLLIMQPLCPSCENNPENIIALGLDTDEHYVLTPKPVLRVARKLFEPKKMFNLLFAYTFSLQKKLEFIPVLI